MEPRDVRPPERFNLASYFLDDRIREGRGDRTALLGDDAAVSYAELQALANRFGNLLRQEGIRPEERVVIALPDGPGFVGALFGVLKIGGVVVMVNPHLRPDAIRGFYEYTRATAALVDASTADAFREAARGARHAPRVLLPGDADLEHRLDRCDLALDPFPTHRDDPAIWLFSGGTSGRPKAVVQTHASFANTTELYGKRTLGLTERDITISVPKLFFGYALGSNLFFPLSVGAAAVLFPDRCTPEALFERIERHRPTVLVNVPTMVQQMVAHPDAPGRDLSSLRFATSAGEALPVELYHRWKDTFGVELLDGLGTAEMWHIFLTNRPGDVRPGTLGRAVAGFDVRVRDDAGRDVAPGEAGTLWVRGDSRAIAYWQNMDATRRAFRGEWYVSEDMLSRDEDGYFTYRGRADDMLKVAGKWLSPGEVENCMLQHPAVREVAVVGVVEDDGLTRPHAYVVAGDAAGEGLDAELLTFVAERLESYKAPRSIVFLEALPRTHLGKVDRGRLRATPTAPERPERRERRERRERH
jgi:benzoate-CoA ligase family protein